MVSDITYERLPRILRRTSEKTSDTSIVIFHARRYRASLLSLCARHRYIYGGMMMQDQRKHTRSNPFAQTWTNRSRESSKQSFVISGESLTRAKDNYIYLQFTWFFSCNPFGIILCSRENRGFPGSSQAYCIINESSMAWGNNLRDSKEFLSKKWAHVTIDEVWVIVLNGVGYLPKNVTYPRTRGKLIHIPIKCYLSYGTAT